LVADRASLGLCDLTSGFYRPVQEYKQHFVYGSQKEFYLQVASEGEQLNEPTS